MREEKEKSNLLAKTELNQAKNKSRNNPECLSRNNTTTN